LVEGWHLNRLEQGSFFSTSSISGKPSAAERLTCRRLDIIAMQEQKVLRPLGLGQKSRNIKVSSVTAFMVKWHLSLDK
jgi:hypothetical protein